LPLSQSMTEDLPTPRASAVGADPTDAFDARARGTRPVDGAQPAACLFELVHALAAAARRRDALGREACGEKLPRAVSSRAPDRTRC
jgi:hypothetical protein